ncbi:hypothetical protein OG864_21685 [Streptomyces sp. NBC_00124]|uniref:hypothetical protein n=1 Tax=Streptomyces sp. NBC_00124 TaxID=2975662 RepID=UPI00224D2445|nr:hypothetical protein [Streptomyces sp. NBC_00124]MCX5361325.1 hypothetical protein [Streptomyces sp. NBC_00124]
MTWPAALPGAALRSLRTAAGRRALQVALLVGGLFALGFLCGGQASAAEGIPTTTATSGAVPADPVDGVRSLTSGAVGRLAKPPAEAEVHHTAPRTDALPTSDDPTSVDDKVLRPATEHVVGVVDGKVLQPVGDLVDTVTEQLAGAQAQMPPLPSLPSLPATEQPGLPGLPELPTLPDLPALPGQTLPDQTPPATTPQPKSPVADSPQGDASGKRSGKAAATAVFYGPPSVAGSPTTGAASKTDGHRAVQGAHTPVPQQTPGDDQSGALGNRPTADSGSSRHGDAHAVSLNHRTAVRLVAGAAVRADAFETRDRHRDIPVSPA